MSALPRLPPLPLAGLAAPGFPEGLPVDRVWTANLLLLALLAAGVAVGVALLWRARARPPDWEAAARRLLWRPWAERDGLRLAAALLALHATLQLVLPATVGGDADAPARAERQALAALLAQGVAFHGTILATVAVLLRRRRIPWSAAFGLRPARWPADAARGVAFYLAALPLVLAYSIAFQALLARAGYRAGPQPVLQVLAAAHSPWLRGYLVFMGVALAPVAEEMLFRGLALPLLARRIGVAPAVAAVSAVFALLHFHVPSLAPLFVVGAAFSVGYLATGSLAVPVAMHAVFNAVNLGVLYLLHV